MKLHQRALGLLLACSLLLTLLPTSALASQEWPTSGTCGDQLNWTLANGTLTVSGTGAMYNYSNPTASGPFGVDTPWFHWLNEIQQVVICDGVEKIGDYAFKDCDNLTAVSIAESVTAIGNYAFASCENLNHVRIPEQVTSMGLGVFHGSERLDYAGPSGGGYAYEFEWTGEIPAYAFSGRHIKGITLPDGITHIGSNVFFECNNLTSITLPEGVTSIDSAAFRDCRSLAGIRLPASITDIQPSAFSGCTALTDVYYAGSEAQWALISIGGENNYLTSAAIHYGSSTPGEEAYSKALLLLEDSETGEPCFENPLDRIPASIDQASLKELVGEFVWVTYDSAAQNEIVDIQPLKSHFGVVRSVSEGSLIVDGQLYPHTVNLPFLEALEGQKAVCHVLDGTVVSVQLPSKRTEYLSGWDVHSRPRQISFGAHQCYVSKLTEQRFLDRVDALVGSEVEYLCIGNVVLGLADDSGLEIEAFKRFQRYDESTNTAYFADDTGYRVADGAALDFTGLEGRWVRCTLRYTGEDPRLTAIQKVTPTVQVELLLDGRDIEYQGGKLRFEGGEFENKASFEIPVTVKVTNSTQLKGVSQDELKGDSTLAVTMEQVEVIAPEGFNFGWFGGGSIELESPVTLQVGDSWSSDRDGKTGYLRLGTFSKPTQAEQEYSVTAEIQTGLGAQRGTGSFTIINLDQGADVPDVPDDSGDTGSDEGLTFWEREFLAEFYKVEDVDVTADGGYFALRTYFDESSTEDIGRLAVYWSSALRSEAAKSTNGEPPSYLKLTCTMTEGRYRGHKATLIFSYQSHLSWFFASTGEINFALRDDQTGAVLIEPQLHSFSVSASAKDFADGLQSYLQVKFGDDLVKFCKKLGTKAIKDMAKDIATMTGEEYINTMLALMEDIDKIAKNAKEFTDYAGKASAILRNPMKASVSSADEFNRIGAKFVSARCPVDVYVYNPAGELCGAVENDTVVVDTGETFLGVSGSEKGVWLNDDYTLKLVATGEGTMDYTISEYSGGVNTRTVYFEDVPLKTGLTYEGAVPKEENVPSAQYALTSSEGQVVYADRDTKAQGYTITFDPNGGTSSETSRTAKTGADGRLTALPASPTRSGYTFRGWYISPSGGTKIDTGYVFHADTTLYAQWSANTTGGSGSNSGSSTGSSYYEIRLLETAHGYLSTSQYRAEWGTQVELRAHPDSGYELDTLWVTNAQGDEISLTERDSDRYTFSMPASRVEVDAIFVRRSASTPSSTPSRPSESTSTAFQSIPTPHAYGQIFTDVPTSHWAAGTIAWAYQNGYMKGVGGGNFRPEAPMTNQQLWMVISRLLGRPAADLEQAEAWAAGTGLANGRAGTGPLTRQAMVADLYQTAFLMGGNVSRQGSLDSYPDGYQLRGTARNVMAWAVAGGIITGTGDGRLRPGDTVTRAQFAAILYRFHYAIL